MKTTLADDLGHAMRIWDSLEKITREQNPEADAETVYELTAAAMRQVLGMKMTDERRRELERGIKAAAAVDADWAERLQAELECEERAAPLPPMGEGPPVQRLPTLAEVEAAIEAAKNPPREPS